MDKDIIEDFKFGQITFRNSSDNEDRKEGIDGWIGEMPVATRKYRHPTTTFGNISIRQRKYQKSEYDKILNGEFKPILYIYEWQDAFAIYRVSDILGCLKDNIYYSKPNDDGLTIGLYIEMNAMPHLLIQKGALPHDHRS